MSKLLQVTTVAPTLAHFIAPIAHHFRETGWVVDGLASDASRSPACRNAFDHVYDVNWNRNPWDRRNLQAAAGHLREIVEMHDYDVVHVHTPVAAWITRFALRKRRPRRPVVIYTAHGFHFHPGGGVLRNTAFRFLERLAGRWTDYLVVINQIDEHAAIQSRIVPAKSVRYIPGIGIDRTRFNREAVPNTAIQAIRTELGLADSNALILMIAEFIPRKCHTDLLHAFALADAPSARLAFAGAGPIEGEMKKLARELGVEDRTRFLGPRGDIPALICASTATALPSRHEGLSRSVMESLALKVPVIGTDVRGIRELLQDGGGRLVPFGDRHGLARAIEWAASNPEAAAEAGKQGYDQMRRYDLQNVLHLHEQLYRHALEN